MGFHAIPVRRACNLSKIKALYASSFPRDERYPFFLLRLLAPVSYTHLDVYKRQEKELVGVGSCALGYPDCEQPAAAPRKDDFVVYVK